MSGLYSASMKRVRAHAKALKFCDPHYISIWQDDDWWIGQFVEDRAVISQGKTIPSLLRNLADAYQLVKRKP